MDQGGPGIGGSMGDDWYSNDFLLLPARWVQDMDPDVHRIIEAEKQRQKRCVNLIASVPGNVEQLFDE